MSLLPVKRNSAPPKRSRRFYKISSLKGIGQKLAFVLRQKNKEENIVIHVFCFKSVWPKNKTKTVSWSFEPCDSKPWKRYMTVKEVDKSLSCFSVMWKWASTIVYSMLPYHPSLRLHSIWVLVLGNKLLPPRKPSRGQADVKLNQASKQHTPIEAWNFASGTRKYELFIFKIAGSIKGAMFSAWVKRYNFPLILFLPNAIGALGQVAVRTNMCPPGRRALWISKRKEGCSWSQAS